MKKIYLYILVLSLVLLFTSVVLAQEVKPAFTLRVGHGDAPGTFKDRASHLFKEKVEAYTDGQVTVIVYPSNQLGKLTTQLEGCQMGTHDIVVTMDVCVNLVPEIGVLDMPYLFKDRHRAERILKGPIGRELLEKLSECGIIGLAWWENGFRHITNNVRPIVTPADLKGLKIRTPASPIRVKTFKTFGAYASPLSFAELFSALQQGVFDGQENPLFNIRGGSFYEVQKYLSLSAHVYNPQIVNMSKILWDKMPPNFQAAVKLAAEEVGDVMRDEGKMNDEKNLEFLRDKMKVNEVDFKAFQQAAKPIYEEFEYQELLNEILAIVQ